MIPGETKPFPVGTKFTPRGKNQRVTTVIDHLTTTNIKGEIVKFRYLCESNILGKPVRNSDVVHTTIEMANNVELPN